MTVANYPHPTAVLLSGSGTTLQNLLDRITAAIYRRGLWRSSRTHAESFGLQRAKRANIPISVIVRKECGSREEFSRRIFEPAVMLAPTLVCLAGFLQLIDVPDDFLAG